MHKKLVLGILTLYILVPILILFNHYLYDIKFYILSGIGLAIFLIFKILKISNEELGITKKNLWKSIKRNLLLITICAMFILAFKYFHLNKYKPNETILFYTFYIFVSCPIQEFLYRGVFGYFDKNKKHNYLWAIISSICYSFAHIIYRDIFTCILTFIIGIIWYILYKKDNNLCGVSLSHMTLGIVTIALGIVN